MTDATIVSGPGPPSPRPSARDVRVVEAAATFFAVAVLLHNADHLRRGGDSVTADVFWLGTAAIILEVGIVVLAFMRHPAAPLGAAAVGFPLALGYLVVHFTPERGWLSDSFTGGEVSALSWAAASLEAAGAVVLGLAGLVALRRGGLVSATGVGARPVIETLRHPVVAAMAIGNILIFLFAVADRYA